MLWSVHDGTGDHQHLGSLVMNCKLDLQNQTILSCAFGISSM